MLLIRLTIDQVLESLISLQALLKSAQTADARFDLIRLLVSLELGCDAGTGQ